MMRSWKLLPLAFAAVLLAGCELADAIEVAVSGPHCGSFGVPSELKERGLALFGDSPEPVPIDETIARLESYLDSYGPDIRFALGYAYIRKGATLSNDPDYFRRGVRQFRWAALCGQATAVSFLSGFYDEGPHFVVDKDPELSACLEEAYEAHQSVRALLAGRVWGCGVRLEDFPE